MPSSDGEVTINVNIKLNPLIATMLFLCLSALSRADDIERFAKGQMIKLQIPGVVIGVFKDGKLIHKSSYGLSVVELHVKTKLDDRFELGSVTKQFTAVATFMLIDEGKLMLNDQVSKFIPEAPPSWQGVTIYKLMHHTSGLPEYALTDGLGLTEEFTRRRFFDELSAMAVDSQPGDAWEYSVTNFALLGWIKSCQGRILTDCLQLTLT